MDASLEQLYKQSKIEVDQFYNNFMRKVTGFHPIAKHKVKDYYEGVSSIIDCRYYKTEQEVKKAVLSFKMYVNMYRSKVGLAAEAIK